MELRPGRPGRAGRAGGGLTVQLCERRRIKLADIVQVDRTNKGDALTQVQFKRATQGAYRDSE
jgi:hypothetical protein